MPNVVHQEGENIQLQITVYTTVNKGQCRDVESFSVSRSMEVRGGESGTFWPSKLHLLKGPSQPLLCFSLHLGR